VRLDISTPQSNPGPFLSAQPSHCFTVSLLLGIQKLQTDALLDSGASACFLDEEFAKLHKFSLVKKPKPVHVEVIDGRPLSSGDVTHETKPLKVRLENHESSIVFNIIKTPSCPVILGLSWLDKYNPLIDWRLRKVTFPTNSLTMEPVKTMSTNKPLFIGARAFMKEARHNTPLVIFATPTPEDATSTLIIPKQYEEFKDVFEKKNADMLPKHRPYDCAIDF